MKTSIFLLILFWSGLSLASQETIHGNESWIDRFIDRIKYLKEGPSIRERLSLKAGPSGTSRVVRAKGSQEEHMQAVGFNTYLSFDLTSQFEMSLGGYVFFGDTRAMNIDIDGDQVRTDGQYRDTTFSPILRYLSPFQAMTNWYWYAMAGPAWSQQSVPLTDFVDNQGVFRRKHKITIESEGGVIGIGLQEILPSKQMHPVYMEFIFSYMLVRKMTLVDASNFSEVQTVKYEEMARPMSGTIYVVNFGLTLF